MPNTYMLAEKSSAKKIYPITAPIQKNDEPKTVLTRQQVRQTERQKAKAAAHVATEIKQTQPTSVIKFAEPDKDGRAFFVLKEKQTMKYSANLKAWYFAFVLPKQLEESKPFVYEIVKNGSFESQLLENQNGKFDFIALSPKKITLQKNQRIVEIVNIYEIIE